MPSTLQPRRTSSLKIDSESPITYDRYSVSYRMKSPASVSCTFSYSLLSIDMRSLDELWRLSRLLCPYRPPRVCPVCAFESRLYIALSLCVQNCCVPPCVSFNKNPSAHLVV